MSAASTTTPELEAWCADWAPPALEFPLSDRGALRAVLRAGDTETDKCEKWLARAARGRGAVDLAIGEGLVALRVGDRLAELGYHLGDYAREVLGIEPRTALQLAQLARELRSRPLLRTAVRAGEVRLRAALEVLPVARGEAEAQWVERARRETVRALQAAVRVARDGAASDEDEEWVRLRTGMSEDVREVVDEALELAGRVLPGATRAERLEAMAQELLGARPALADDAEERPLGGSFRTYGARSAAEERRAEKLEVETDRWAFLPRILDVPPPDAGFDEIQATGEIDARLRLLARFRAGWDDAIGGFAHALQESRVPELLGFASFRHFVEERLGLPARAVEQRVALERRLHASPALREAKRQGLSYEKLRALSHLPERELAAWVPRAHALTCIELKRRLEAEAERQLCARRVFSAPMPRRVACLLAAAIRTVRALAGTPVPSGECLAVLAQHFLDVWGPAVKRPSRAQRVRERDGDHCMAPGCSRRATQSHHVQFRSRGGGNEEENLVALCAFHHLRCIHGGWLRVSGRAPEGLTWERGLSH